MGNLQWWFARIFEPFSSFSFFLFYVTKYSAIHDSCSFCFITTMLWVALDISYISIAKSVVFSRWATVRHMRTILIGNYRSASIYGLWGGMKALVTGLQLFLGGFSQMTLAD